MRSEGNHHPDGDLEGGLLPAVLARLMAEHDTLPVDLVTEVFDACLADLQAPAAGALPELVYRLAHQRLRQATA